jgi:hypothetical protein
MTSTSRARGGAAGAPGPGAAAGAGTGAQQLRLAIIALLRFAAAEEEMLLASVSRASTQPAARAAGSAQCWAAAPVIAHNTEFKRQQVQRLNAILTNQVPPEFGDIDHASAEVYRAYVALSPDQVARDSSRVSAQLIDGLTAVSEDDLRDPARHPWLRGRLLWLQITVRGFWHPTGHIGGYYLEHSQPDRAVACYNLACAQARAGRADDAAATLREAIALNPDVRVNAAHDPDLAILRSSGRLGALLG